MISLIVAHGGADWLLEALPRFSSDPVERLFSEFTGSGQVNCFHRTYTVGEALKAGEYCNIYWAKYI